MNNRILVPFLLLFVACAGPRRTMSILEARESTYQVRGRIVLDTSSISANSSGLFPLVSSFEDGPVRAASMTRVVKVTDGTLELGWSGTGWTVAARGSKSFVMTAGHVCESGRRFRMPYFDISTFTRREIELPIIERSHTLVSYDGVEVHSSIILDEDMDDDFNGNDLCVLGAMADLGLPITIGRDDPEFGDRAEVIGGPKGLWGGGIAVASDVKFSGRGSVFRTSPDGLAFNGEVAPGNSGSAVMYRGMAVGVISLGAVRFPSLVHAVPHEKMRDFLRRALHSE